MIGMPPPQLASKAMQVFCFLARAKSSGPRAASRLLLAVMTGLPSFSARSTKLPAGVVAAHQFQHDLHFGIINGRGGIRCQRQMTAARVFGRIAHDNMANVKAKPRPALQQIGLPGEDFDHAAPDDAATQQTDADRCIRSCTLVVRATKNYKYKCGHE